MVLIRSGVTLRPKCQGPKCLNVVTTGLESQEEAHLVSGAWTRSATLAWRVWRTTYLGLERCHLGPGEWGGGPPGLGGDPYLGPDEGNRMGPPEPRIRQVV